MDSQVTSYFTQFNQPLNLLLNKNNSKKNKRRPQAQAQTLFKSDTNPNNHIFN